MKTFYKQLSIKQKLLMLFSIQIIIPLIFMGMMIYRTSEGIIQSKSIDYSSDLLKMITLRFNDFSKNVFMASQDILYDPILYEILADDGNESATLNREQLDKMNNILRKVCLSRDEIQAVAIIDNSLAFYAYDVNSGRASIQKGIDYEVMHAHALEGKGALVWFVQPNEGGNIQGIYALRSIYDINRYHEIGLMVIEIKKEQLESVYGNLSTEFMENIAIVTEDGALVVGTGMPAVVEAEGIDKENNVLVAYGNIANPPWRIQTEISLDKLNEELDAFRTYFVWINIATFLMLSLLSLFMAVDIIDPIKRLVDAMRQMKQEKIHDVIDVDRKDELGYLSVCFNDMSQEIDVLLNQVYREQLTRKEAELKTLQAQINPHFLFNTLESINWMARLNEVPEISQMVTALSAILEASIGKGGAMVTLREEVAFVDSYILIMKNRYGERLTFTKQMEREILGMRVPKLILQPVIENAIYHGIDKNRRAGLIHLEVLRQEKEVRIIVEDNGSGIEEEQLKLLNDTLLENDDKFLIDNEFSELGIGLRNVNRRIKLFYGQHYGAFVESRMESYTRVILTLPLESVL
jgi:two-component system, sensor histidine kinase YesM